MAEIRQGYLDDYTQITSGNIGIGTSSASDAKFEIIGGTTTQELNVTGIASFTSVSGFIEKHTNYTEDVNITFGDSGTLSGEIIVGSGLTMNVGIAATASQGSVDSLKVSNMFQPPSGTTNQRPAGKPGALFYNFDFKTIEFFDGNSWKQVDNRITRGRGVFSGGGYPYAGNTGPTIEFIEISTLGDSTEFGNNTLGILSAGNSDGTRGTFSGGFDPFRDVIEYITIASSGNTIDFGDLTQARAYAGSASSSTRGLIIGGYTPSPSGQYLNTIDYIEIQTIGNAIDFGDCVRLKPWDSSTQSPTRGVYMSGSGTVGPSTGTLIEFVTIASKGNATRFGESTTGRRAATGGGNSVRGIFVGGYLSNALQYNVIDFVTLASEGNAIDFGENLFTGSYSGAVANNNRMVIAGGYNAPSIRSASMSHITISTTGDATDFGDMSSGGGSGPGAVSDSHGGLGGY